MNSLVMDKIWEKYYKNIKSLDLFILGFSEGGSYVIWTVKCLKNPQNCSYFTNTSNSSSYKLQLYSFYSLKKVAAMDGAYDLFQVVLPFLTTNVGSDLKGNTYRITYQGETNLAKSALAAITLMGYCTYILGNSYLFDDFINYKFNAMICTAGSPQQACQLSNIRYSLTTILSAKDTQLNILRAIGFSAQGKSMNDYATPYANSSLYDLIQGSWYNSVKSLVTKVLTNQTFLSSLKDASIIDFGGQIDINTLVFTLSRDSVVPMNNTVNFEEKARKNNKVRAIYFENDKHLVCNIKIGRLPVDHARAESLANIFALHFIQ